MTLTERVSRVIPGEIWLDENPDARALPWFKVTAYDDATGTILGYRWPTPFPNPGQATRKFVEEHPRLGQADISDIGYFRKWCVL